MSRHPTPIRGVILDLDDTLYPEHSYFLSGLNALGKWLDHELNESGWPERLLRDCETQGRSGIIDRIPVPAGRPPIAWKKTLLHIYRTHNPSIATFDDVPSFFAGCGQKRISLGIVTDGKSVVQHAKIQALDLISIEHIVCTDDIDCPKPSPLPFLVAALKMGVEPKNCAYIADDPSKDFVGPNELGIFTIQITRGLSHPLAKPAPDPKAEAVARIHSLTETHALISRSIT